jgi:nitrogenase molybdenum-iron protein alpha/beta subunit
MNPFTVSNPANPSETYTFGSRGRKKVWVSDGIENGSIKIPDGYLTAAEKIAKINSEKPIVEKINKAPKIIENETLIDDTGVKFWKWIGVNNKDDDIKLAPSARCIVIADNASDAIRELNKTFKHNLVGQAEFNSCWKKFDPDSDVIKTLPIGTYQFVNDAWEKRRII